MSADYLRENTEFYTRFWREHPLYRTPYPNGDEGSRAAVVLRFLSQLVEARGAGQPPPRILDVGCGRGWLTHLVSTFGPSAGCEPVPAAVDLARQLFPGLPFHCGTLGALLDAARVERVDVIVTSEVIEHVPPEAKADFVAEIRAALVPGGHCIITTPRAELQAAAGESSSQLIEAWMTERELAALFRAHSFTLVAADRAHPTNATAADRLIRGVARRLGRLPASLDHALAFRSSLYQIAWFRLAS